MKSAKTRMQAALVVAATLFLTLQTTAQTAQNVGATTAKDAQKKIGFRMLNWKKRCVHNADEANQLIASLEKIGCEVVQANHNGHMDVSYRCPEWKTITVENDTFQAQWTNWMGTAGLDTVMIDPPATPGLELIRYRLPEWQTFNVQNVEEANRTIKMLKMVGCEADQHNNNGAITLRFRCAEWSTIALKNQQSASDWQTWMNNLGFQTERSQ